MAEENRTKKRPARYGTRAPNFKHGHCKHPLYNTWFNMVQRCTYPNDSSFAFYGGRGISVCDRWRNSFPLFAEDMGPRPEGRSLDRIDNDGPYCPENCRWATKVEQMRNRSMKRIMTLNGVSMSMCEWAAKLGVTTQFLSNRVNHHGWTDERALSQPARRTVNGKRIPVRLNHA